MPVATDALRAIGEAHLVADRFIVGFAHEAGQRREAAVAEHLKVADLAWREVPGGPIAGLFFDFFGAAGGDLEVDELATVRGIKMTGHWSTHSFLGVRIVKDA